MFIYLKSFEFCIRCSLENIIVENYNFLDRKTRICNISVQTKVFKVPIGDAHLSLSCKLERDNESMKKLLILEMDVSTV